MSDKPIAMISAFVLMAGCCLGVPLLLMVLSGSAVAAWVRTDGVAWLAMAAFVVAVLMLYRRSRRRAGPRRRTGPVAVNPTDENGAARLSGLDADTTPRGIDR